MPYTNSDGDAGWAGSDLEYESHPEPKFDGKIDISKVADISRTDGVSAAHALIKCQEEVGELATAFLCQEGAKNVSASADSNVLEEGTDVVMCALDVMFKSGKTAFQINQMLGQKMTKWKAKIEKNKVG